VTSGKTSEEIFLNVAGNNALTYMDATPTLQELWARRVFMPPDAVAMTAYHWYWSASQHDSTGRPLLGGA
jgi:hypothetical protein